MQDELVPQCNQSVQTSESEQRIRQITVDILGRSENRPVLLDPEVDIKRPQIKNAPMINERHKTDDGYHE